mmetsp:Transcript_55124/g.102069  ORF Transcript_55124/g.102069 Transcript_55124/m.102069 type:complete len:268 (+) Transcript_55124:57-860(+)
MAGTSSLDAEQIAVPACHDEAPDEEKRRKGDLQWEIEVSTRWGSILKDEPECQSEQIGNREVWVVDGLFTEEECNGLLEASEQHGFGTTNYPKSYRGNLRLITTDPSMSDVVWKRLKPHVPAVLHLNGEPWEAVGLNECWRLAKYYPGDRFCGHCDACFERTDSEVSMLTVNIYMNGGFLGGRTRFYQRDRKRVDFAVEPQAGRCLLFRQPPGEKYFHDGEALASGTKYLFRSDVMYARRSKAAGETNAASKEPRASPTQEAVDLML